MTVCRTLFVCVIGMALVGVLAAPGFGQTQTGQSAMVTANLSQTDIVITQSKTCHYNVQCAKGLAVANGCATIQEGSWATSNKCTLYSGGITSGCAAISVAPLTCWTCVDSGGTATVTLSGSTLGESVTVNTKNSKTSKKYSWSLFDPVTGDFRVSDLATTGVGTAGPLMTTDILGKSLGCSAGTFAYVGQNPQATGESAWAALIDGDVCTILKGDSLPGNDQDAADRRDYTQDWTISASDLSACPDDGACTFTFEASATIKGVAGLGTTTATASACVTVSAENCQNISCP